MHCPSGNQLTSIRTKVALTTLLTVSIVLICVSWSLFLYFHNLLRESIFKQQFVLVSEIAEQLDGRVKLARHQLSLAATEINRQVLADPDKLQQVLSNFSHNDMIFDAGYLVIGTNGRVIAEDMGFPALAGMDLRSQDYVDVPLQSGRTFISEPFRFSLPPHNPMIAMVVPVRDNDGRVICLLAGHHSLGGKQFLTSLSSNGLGSTGYLYLLHGRTILMHHDSTRILETIAEGKNRGIDQAVKGIEGSLDNVNSRGQHMLSSFKRVGETGWILAANIPYDDAFGQMKKLAFNAVLISAAGIVFSLLIVWYVTRRVTQPIEQLISHVDGIYKDGGEWKPLELKTGDELERLANAFNGMMDEIKRAEEEQRILSWAVDNNPNTIVISDPDGTIEYVNHKFCTLTGYSAAEAIGQNPRVLKSGEMPPEKYAELWQTITKGDIWHGEFHNKKKSGELYWESATIAPILDDQGKILRYLAVKEDITQRKMYEEELLSNTDELLLKHSELNDLFSLVDSAKREWEDTMDSIPEMVLMCDPSGDITRCNRAVTTFTGLSYNEILGLDCLGLFSRSGMEVISCDDTSGQMVCKDGARHFELLYNELKQIGASDVRGTVVTIHETTEFLRMNESLQKASAELQQAQAQAFQQEKMASIGQLAAGVAHEINNPMGFISSNLTSMGKYMQKLRAFETAVIEVVQNRGDQETVELLNDVRAKMKIDFILNDLHSLLEESQDGAQRVRCIVRDLKSFSHEDEARCKPFCINECLDSSLNMARNEIKYVADVERDYDPGLQLINCYPQKLNQVFMNLLVNAAHAIEGHGTIRVKTFNEGGDIVVCISDSGKGIAPENLTRIFEPFFTTKEVGKGTGLGLSISYDIIKKHGGAMTVESMVGAGTTFTVRLPLNHVVSV